MGQSFARFLALQSRKVEVEKANFCSEKINSLTNSISSAAASFESTWSDLICALPAFNLQSFVHPNIVPKLDAMESLLVRLKIDIDAFLEEKRIAFPRLFFLADAEVLTLFASDKDDFDNFVQPVFEKLFQGVKSVEHDGESITAMISNLGEKVFLVEPVSFKTSPEKWIPKFEASMKNTVKLAIQKAHETFENFENRIDWIKSNPAQASIVVTQIKHAEMVEKAIADDKLEEAIESINEQLANLT